MRNKTEKKKGVLMRLIRTMFEFFPVMMPAVLICILFNAVISSIPAVFMQNIISAVETSWQSGDWQAAGGRILRFVALLAVFYILS